MSQFMYNNYKTLFIKIQQRFKYLVFTSDITLTVVAYCLTLKFEIRALNSDIE